MIARSADSPMPNVRRLFDERVLEEMLRRVFDGPKPISDVRIDRCWPRGEHGFAFQWSFRVDRSDRHSISGILLDTVRRSHLKNDTPAQLTPRGIRGLHMTALEHGLLLFSADCDPALPQLAACLDESAMAVELAQLRSPAGRHRNGQSPTCSSRLLSHKPGRRAAIEYTVDFSAGDTIKLAGKTFRNDSGRALIETHRRLNEQLSARGDSRVRVADPVGFLEDHKLALFAWHDAHGPSKSDPLAPDSIRAAAEGLAALHKLSTDEAPSVTSLDECRVIERWIDAVKRLGAADVSTAERAFDLLRGVGESLTQRPRCTVHGDYYEKQLISDQQRITLFDLDTLSHGDPCRDLGNLLAHVYLNCLKAGESQSAFKPLASAALSQYQSMNASLDPRALRFYLTAAMLRVGAVHALRTTGRRFAQPMWDAGLSALTNVEWTAGLFGVASQRSSS